MSRLVARRVGTALGEGKIAIVLSGSCHTAIGSVAALEGRRRGVIWLDAHGDFNTPDTTTSGLLDGTTLATITGRCYAGLRESVDGFVPIADENVLMLGVRELDPGEKRLLEGSRITRVGTERALRESGQILAAYGQNTDAVYLHLDVDVLDPSSGAANAYACPGGYSARELARLLRAIARMTAARVLVVTSYDPDSDEDGRACDAALRAIQAFIEARVSKVC